MCGPKEFPSYIWEGIINMQAQRLNNLYVVTLLVCGTEFDINSSHSWSNLRERGQNCGKEH